MPISPETASLAEHFNVDDLSAREIEGAQSPTKQAFNRTSPLILARSVGTISNIRAAGALSPT